VRGLHGALGYEPTAANAALTNLEAMWVALRGVRHGRWARSMSKQRPASISSRGSAERLSEIRKDEALAAQQKAAQPKPQAPLEAAADRRCTRQTKTLTHIAVRPFLY